jgi:hypothetical protein
MNSKQISSDDKKDLLVRWQKARLSAVEKAKPHLSPAANIPKSQASNELLELENFLVMALQEPSEVALEQLYKNVFDHSRQLALSFSKHKEVVFEIEDFKELFQDSEIPCLKGEWQQKSEAYVLKRAGCESCLKGNSAACHFWREAFDGLVMGLGDKERFVRHACQRQGDEACVDILFNDVGTAKKNLAWGQVPEHMSPGILKACDDFKDKMKIGIEIKGLNEGILYYQFESSSDRLCGGGKILEDAFARKVQKIYPGIQLKETSPLAVMGTEK